MTANYIIDGMILIYPTRPSPTLGYANGSPPMRPLYECSLALRTALKSFDEIDSVFDLFKDDSPRWFRVEKNRNTPISPLFQYAGRSNEIAITLDDYIVLKLLT